VSAVPHGEQVVGPARRDEHGQQHLVAALVLVVVVVGLVSSLGAPLIPAIAASRDVSPAAAQWSLTATLLTGAVTAVFGLLLGGGRRRPAVRHEPELTTPP
jgi:predicted MFS family arabinose efflux permease